MNTIRQFVATLLTCALIAATSPAASAQEAQQANLSAGEIDSIVSPIALYPDQLVAQILGAATYPDQVSAASNWINSNQGLQGDALMQAADKQPWDPSVKALTQFPTVLDQMAKNLAWTSALGDAAYNQQKDVMASIQRLRQQAKAAGNLKSSQQIQVVQQDPQTIVIQPANPQVVYVPTYSPTVVYGTPYNPPGYSTGAMVATGLLSFGVGIAVGAAINNNGCCGWGWNSWGCGWHGGSVTYNRNVYVSRSNTFYGSNRQHYRNNYYGGNRPTHYNGNNRYNGGNNRVNGGNNRNTNISGNNVNINTGNRNPNNNNRPNVGGNNNNRPNNGGNRNPNLSNNNRPGNNNNRPGGNGNNRPGNNNNRPGGNGNNRPGGNDNRQNMANRGYGQKPAGNNNSSAFGGYKQGGNARADGNRGRQSMGGGGAGRAKPAAARGGGGGGGGGRGRGR